MSSNQPNTVITKRGITVSKVRLENVENIKASLRYTSHKRLTSRQNTGRRFVSFKAVAPPGPMIFARNECNSFIAKLLEVTVNPAFSSGKLKAGGIRRGEFGRSKISQLLTLTCNEVGEILDHPTLRCGITRFRHHSSISKRFLHFVRGRKWQRPRESREGESVSTVSPSEVYKCLRDIPREVGRQLVFRAKRSSADGVAKVLKHKRGPVPSTRVNDAVEPLVYEPSHAKAIPARKDKSRPAGSPNLLVRGRIASMLSGPRCLLTQGTRILLHGMALYK
jgi:hypothetical protein